MYFLSLADKRETRETQQLSNQLFKGTKKTEKIFRFN